MKKSLASCLLFFTLLSLAQSIIIDKGIYISNAHSNTTRTKTKGDPKRLLQTIAVTKNTAPTIQQNLLTSINTKRTKAKVEKLA